MTYFIFTLYSSLCLVFANKLHKNTFLLLITFGLVIFSGLRFESGIDYFNYLRLYSNNSVPTAEYLYWFVSILHHKMLHSFPFFVFIVAIITISTKIYVLDKLSTNVLVSIYIYICLSYIYLDMGYIRNSIALALFMICILMQIKNKKFLSYIFFIVAFFFHQSVAFMVYIFFINAQNNAIVSKKYIWLLFACLVISALGIIKPLMISFVAQIHPFTVQIYFLKTTSNKLLDYLQSNTYQKQSINIFNVRFCVVAFIVYFFRERIKNQFLIKIYIIGASLMLLLGFNSQLYARLGVFLAFFEMLLIPYILIPYSGARRLACIAVIIVFYGIIYFKYSYAMEIYLVRLL